MNKVKYSGVMDFPGGSVVKNLLAIQETQEMQIRYQGHDDALGKEMTTHWYSCLENPMDNKPS